MEKIGRTKIVDLLKRTDIGAMVNVKGWVRTRRGSKQVNFIALNDGSTINNLHPSCCGQNRNTFSFSANR